MKLPLTSKCQNKERQRNMSPLLCCPNLGRRQVLALPLLPLFCLEKSQTEAQKIIANRTKKKRKAKEKEKEKRKKAISKKLSLEQQQQKRQTRTILIASKQIMLILLTVCVALIIIPLPSNQVPSSRQLHSKMPLTLPLQLNANLNQITPQPLFLSPSASSNQHPDAPKLIPLSALDRYQEGAELKLFCSASAPPSGGRLQLEWRKNSAQQLAPVENVGNSHQTNGLKQTGGSSSSSSSSSSSPSRNLHISMMDDSSSVLRINNLEADDSGNYTCLARNQFGFDSSTVRVNVNVRLKWFKEPPAELQVRAGKSVQLECDASGQPTPLISWTSLKDLQTINSKVLRLDRVQVNDSGLYECKASNQKHLMPNFEVGQSSDQVLRKVVRLIVNGKYLK